MLDLTAKQRNRLASAMKLSPQDMAELTLLARRKKQRGSQNRCETELYCRVRHRQAFTMWCVYVCVCVSVCVCVCACVCERGCARV